MARSLSETKKFCFLFPIKQSFLSWGYAKLLITIVLLTCFLDPTAATITEYTRHFPVYMPQVVTYWMLPCVFIIDIVLQVMFIVGTYRLSVDLWKAYYYYSKLVLCLSPILGLYTLIVFKGYIRYARWYGDSQQMTLLSTATIIMFVSLIIQIPIMMTLKSELDRIKFSTFKNEVITDTIAVKIENQPTEADTHDYDENEIIVRNENNVRLA